MSEYKATTGLEDPNAVVAVPAEPATATMDTSNVPMWEQEKQGGKCCGCCCDYRRAVIILSIIFIILGIVGVISGSSTNTNNIEDDDLADAIDGIADDYESGGRIIAILGLINSIISLVGAIMYNKYMVGFTVVYGIASYLAAAIVGMRQLNEVLDYVDDRDLITNGLNTTAFDDDIFNDFDGNTEEVEDSVVTFIRVFSIINYVIGALITLFFLYPSCFLVKEIHSGIMSQETYPREQFSCCCAPSRAPQ